MKKVLFKFSDFSGYDSNLVGSIYEYGDKLVLENKYTFNSSTEEVELFDILCKFVLDFNEHVDQVIEVKTKNKEIDEDYFEDENIKNIPHTGNWITSKILDVDLQNRCVYTKNYVGILRTIMKIQLDNTMNKEYDVTIEIGSRFDQPGKYYFLEYLISKVILGRFIELSKPRANEQGSVWDWLVVYVFKYHLENAFKKGVFKKYKLFEYNDSRLNGTFNVSKHIKHNIPFTGKIAYTKRELTYNNEIMQLIITAFDFLKKKYPYIVNNIIQRGGKAFEAISTIKEVVHNYKTINKHELIYECAKKIAHPYYHEYESLRITSLNVLKNKEIGIFEGSSSEILGIILNISNLWEIFLEECIFDSYLKNINYVKQHKVKINVLNKEINFRPDFFIEHNNNRFVLDAKYKMSWNRFVNNLDFQTIKDDYLQIVNYIYILDAKWGGVIFPSISEYESKDYYFTIDSKRYFYLFNLSIPSYENEKTEHGKIIEWRKKLETNIKKMADTIYEEIESYK